MAWQRDAASAILSVQSGMYMVFRNYQHPELSIAVHIHSSLQARAGYNVARGATRISQPLLPLPCNVCISNCNCNWGTCIAPLLEDQGRITEEICILVPVDRMKLFSDHDETSPSITAVSALSVACSTLAVQQQKMLCRKFVDSVTSLWLYQRVTDIAVRQWRIRLRACATVKDRQTDTQTDVTETMHALQNMAGMKGKKKQQCCLTSNRSMSCWLMPDAFSNASTAGTGPMPMMCGSQPTSPSPSSSSSSSSAAAA